MICSDPCFGCTPDDCTAHPGHPVDLADPLAATLEFMTRAGQLPNRTPHELPDADTRMSRVAMLTGPRGEVTEYLDAEAADDPLEILDGGIDSAIVALGTVAAYFGPRVTAEAVRIITASNLAKVTGPHGVIKDDTGKVRKPPGWQDPKPRLAALLRAHGWEIAE